MGAWYVESVAMKVSYMDKLKGFWNGMFPLKELCPPDPAAWLYGEYLVNPVDELESSCQESSSHQVPQRGEIRNLVNPVDELESSR